MILSALFSLINEPGILILKEVHRSLLSMTLMNSGWQPSQVGVGCCTSLQGSCSVTYTPTGCALLEVTSSWVPL